MREEEETGIDIRRLFKTSAEIAEEAYANIQKYQNKEFLPARTCYEYLNEAMLGGLYPQNVMAIGARPGVGKSYVTQKIIESVMDPYINPQSRDYLLINCEFEMTGMDLLNRRISREMGKSIKSILLNKPTTIEEEKMKSIVEKEKKENVIYIPNPITVEELRLAIRHIMGKERNKRRKLVIWKIDHILLLKREGGDPKRTMDNAIAVINNAKLEYPNLFFIIDAQFNRNIEERRAPKEHEPRLSDFYQSDELGQLCSIMIGLNNPRRMGYDSYMSFPETWYRSLDVFKTPSRRSFQTEGLLFHHVLKVRQIRIEDLVNVIYPEVMPGYGPKYGQGGVKYINPERPPEPPREYTLEDENDSPF